MVNTLGVDNETKQTIEALQNELQKTREKLQAVEELKKQSGIFRFRSKVVWFYDVLVLFMSNSNDFCYYA